MARAYVSVGSNVEPEHNVRRCLDTLERRFGALQISPVYRNPPVGFEGEDFYNLAVGFDTALAPALLAGQLKAIEQAQGRRRQGVAAFAPRTLDLDLLLYDQRISRHPRLPHPDILRYAFVLQPLAEIAGDRRHPRLGTTLARLWEEFSANESGPLRAVSL
ncbi:MAG: 2-amino-4-hydroxy-6-hydroxymethyldihydropteridine diphosphokinase [Candidatus Competibacterales bacterium]|nr:2-amino-4-hydroxy-6-hydroxymethyldihydropteridine diphosphokinase [Candidatus Competibacterales bacterium]